MMVREDVKVAFLLLPKCGSMSIKQFLPSFGFKPLLHETFSPLNHTKYQDAVKVYPELVEYTKYGVFRDPLARFVSAVNYVRGLVDQRTYDEFVAEFETLNQNQKVFFERQVEWLDEPGTNVLDFDNLADEVSAVVNSLGRNRPFPRLNETARSNEPVSDGVKDFVRSYYASDYQFAKDVLQKEYQ